MSEQGHLFGDPPPLDPGDLKEAAARAFHHDNPHVLHDIVAVCVRVHRVGRKRWGIKAAFEVVRYNREVTTNGLTYKLNNNHAPYYARWIMRDVPELAGFFVTRASGRVAQRYFE